MWLDEALAGATHLVREVRAGDELEPIETPAMVSPAPTSGSPRPA